MKLKDKLKDTYINGVLLALICVPLTYFVANGIREMVIRYKADPYLYPPPAAQLGSLLFSILIFRGLMINLQKEKIGKGYFFILALASFIYFFVYYKLRSET